MKIISNAHEMVTLDRELTLKIMGDELNIDKDTDSSDILREDLGESSCQLETCRWMKEIRGVAGIFLNSFYSIEYVLMIVVTWSQFVTSPIIVQ